MSARKPLFLKFCGTAPPEAVIASAARFWARVERPSDPDGCWNWIGARKNDGSALWHFNYEKLRYRIPAYRAALMIHGMDLDSDDVVFRTCRNPVCVNPKHLAVGDHEDNVRARVHAGNTAKGVQNGRAKLTEKDVAEIKMMLLRGASNKSLADIYGVDTRAIWGIAAGRVWKHVSPKAEAK
jgi:hypothetical protein